MAFLTGKLGKNDNESLVYSTNLPKPVEDNRVSFGLGRPNNEGKTDFVSSFLKRTIQGRNPSAEADSLKHKIQFLDTTKVKQRKHPASKRKKITAKAQRELKLFELNKNQQRYEMYLPLHKLWVEYMKNLMNFESMRLDVPSQWETKLLKADYHGCLLTVTRSKCPSLVGQTGILIQESKNTFRILTKESILKTIPKESCAFTFALDDHVFTIYGKHFQFKASERSHRKFKAKKTLDL